MPRKKQGNYRRLDVLFDLDDPADAEGAALFDELRRASGQTVKAFVIMLARVYAEQQDAPDAVELVRELGHSIGAGISEHMQHTTATQPANSRAPSTTAGEIESGGINMDRPRSPKANRGHEMTSRLPPPDRTVRES